MAGADGSHNPLTRAALGLHRGIRQLPADLAAALAVVAVTDVAALAPVIRETPVRVVFGLAFVLFVPGYAFVAALFPERSVTPLLFDDEDRTANDEVADDEIAGDRGIDGLERVALSFGLSIAIVPLIGLVLNFTPWGIRLVPILLSLSGFTIVAVAVAAYRRWDLPIEERFRVPYREWVAAGRAELFAPATRTDAVLNVALVASVLLATSSVGYAVLVPQQGEQFSEFYLLTEDDDGELVADNYPTEFTVDEGRPLVVGIGNQEHERTNYTVVSQLQRVRMANSSSAVIRSSNSSTATAPVSSTVERSERLATFSTTLGHNESWHNRYTVAPTFEGQDLRLLFLLYRGSPPEEPSIDNAYREVHLWVNVTA
ncbi:DUF1616 domain-containing protein [Halosimplex pelagicum]|uniref:DUF1616 domain-containing protein n=1 Tax=Halosimplex pelagicum TaxID=869886 RepID=A0A7D5TER6_9EURY|nr:DUF1616 domain-containing protein [Halosimplex pelagicum]